MRLIDAEQLSKHKYAGVEYDGIDMGIPASAVNILAYKWGWNDALASVMDYAPTVDAVEVVRCKDCKKYIPCQKLPIGTSKWCDLFDRATCEMNYCGWGERREDGKTD